MAEIESAIPPHLIQERIVPAQIPPGYEPPVAAYTQRFSDDVKDLVIAILGAQYYKDHGPSPTAGLNQLLSFIDKAPTEYRPLRVDLAAVTDNVGAYNETVIAYWRRREDYLQWQSHSGFEKWFEGLDATHEEHGWFLEVFFPTVDRFETIFSDNDYPEGAAHMRTGVSGPVREHVYWGSMRDRMPLSQVDTLEGYKAHISPHDGKAQPLQKRIRVPGRKNLAMIRSGQDWSATSPHERKLYLETMHPVLIKGMTFLRDHGEEVGCFSCRFMEVLPDSHSPILPTTGTTEKTFGLAYFDDLSSLEGWSKQHKTHLDIFGRFMQYAKELGGQQSLRLFHEVLVLEPEQQRLEYVGCHGKTGMLAGLDT